jgi:hypothetical protein
MSLVAGELRFLPFTIGQTNLLAGTSSEVYAPTDGHIVEILTIAQVAVTTGGTITVLTGAAGAVTVGGLTATIANGATKGSRVSDKSNLGDATRFVAKGERIQVKPTGFATAGAIDGWLVLASTNSDPAL